ncbi:DUF3408 domain-containing protein [Sphingobacterium sp. SRCM116780]|uniref:DUF3408 domain-containing protein n=1 Tax=Sphingobacterium sp. SRCM116780 TaxID=2907623 RepID=UPI001F3D29C6|nr:DUF3408 domain-containing protein [Sphingobacterium sp. SRCM116780]UIR57848.1 DUF3408 domain-containing protein [Sphingobacterium sp. SRCM116780]
MTRDKGRKDFEKPIVDEDYLMNVMSGEEPLVDDSSKKQLQEKEVKPREKFRAGTSKKMDYEETFLVNRFPAGRNGKVVYIRSEYHERLLRIVQLTREEKITLYSYIDNILEQHFNEYGDDITQYFNDRFKPIL